MKKYKDFIFIVLIIAVRTPYAYKLAYIERGYRAIGGEACVPLLIILLWHIYRELKAIIHESKL